MTTMDAGGIGARSLTYMELSRCCTLYRERRFQKLYFSLRDLVASLPELLHHLPAVVDLLVGALRAVALRTLLCGL